MAKATAQDVVNLGFNSKQFEIDSNATLIEADGFVDSILQAFGSVVSDAVGASFYAAATGADLIHITEAEKYLTAAELLRRLPNFEQAKMSKSRSTESVEDENRRILERAKSADNTAATYLMRLGVDVENAGGLAVGFTESDHFRASA